MARYQKLGEILRAQGLISQKQLEQALAVQRTSGERLGKIIVGQKWLTEDQILSALSERFGIPKVRIDAYSIDPEIVKLVPVEMAKRYKIIPLFLIENMLTIAMSDPLDVNAIDAIRYRTRMEVQEAIASEKDIEAAIEKYYSMVDSMDEMISNLEEEQILELHEVREEEINQDSDADESTVIKLVNVVLLEAIKAKASDIHMEPDDEIFRIRYRIDGVLHEISKLPFNLANMIISRIKILSDLDVSEKRIPQDGRFRVKNDNKEIDLRVSILPTVYGEKAVLRILDSSRALLHLDDLGFQKSILQKWNEAIHASEGIILITGPTGSGKTTTLYAVLNSINTIDKNIVTVENPVEYKLPLINQVQINPKAGLTFASTLRAILRQDPDIIMLGEIRDTETAEIAIRSALTGHLVLSTLHTNDAPGAISRLVDMGVEPFLVSSSVVAVLAQRLVRCICSGCKVPDHQGLAAIKKRYHLKINGQASLYRGKGCRECNGTGYRGRTGIHELLVVDSQIRRLIMEGQSAAEIRDYARSKGMMLLHEDGLRKAFAGITSLEEVMRVASDQF